MQPKSITRQGTPSRRAGTQAFGALAAALAVCRNAFAAFLVTLAAASTLALRAAVDEQAAFADAPEYVPLFAPRAHSEAYRAAVSPLGLDAVLASLADEESLVRAPGAWRARHESAQDAFGLGGDYNRWTLARLYGSIQPRVARGPRQEHGAVAESWILISPYPDPSLTRLEPGTLRIIVDVTRP